MVNPSLPSPVTWSPQDKIFVPRLRADLTDAVALLAARPYFVGQQTTGQSFVSANEIVVTMDTELTDAWNGHQEDISPAFAGVTADYWAPLPGWYLCDARIPFSYTSSTPAPFMAGFIAVVGVSSTYGPVHGPIMANGSTSATVTPRCVDLIQQTIGGAPGGQGDFIQPLARQDSGSAQTLSVTAFALPTVSIRWVCAVSGTQPLPVPPLTAVPSPITSAWLNANLRDAVNFLVYPPVCKAHTTSGSVASGNLSSPKTVSPGTVDVDNYGAYSAGLYTAPVSGRYIVAGQVNFASSSTTATYACGIQVNGTAVLWGDALRFAGSGLAGGAGVTKRIRLSAGDTVQLVAAQNSGAALNLNTTASNQTRLIVVWEGI